MTKHKNCILEGKHKLPNARSPYDMPMTSKWKGSDKGKKCI